MWQNLQVSQKPAHSLSCPMCRSKMGLIEAVDVIVKKEQAAIIQRKLSSEAEIPTIIKKRAVLKSLFRLINSTANKWQ